MTVARAAIASIATLFVMGSYAPYIAAGERPNVLFISIDDLRPELGCYGEDHMSTPQLDSFAKSCRIFNRHYVQVPTCGASRFSMLTGRYPSSFESLRNTAFELLQAPEAKVTTLPGLFRTNGYYTVSIGKVSHSPDGRRYGKESKGDAGDGSPEIPNAWDEVGAPVGLWKDGWSAFFAYANGRSRERGKTPPVESADVDDHAYPDAWIADEASRQLEKRLKNEQPFFMAVGFYKPHLPFSSPKKYWELYNRPTIQLAEFRRPPFGTNRSFSLHDSSEVFRNYGQHPPNARESDDYARQLRHAYFAASSYVDTQVGRLLETLQSLDPENKTIVVVWGDHGWHLGEHGLWGKHTLHDVALRSTLLMRTPGMKRAGEHSAAVVESVSLFPTIAELCGLDVPKTVQGQSLVHQLRDPESSARGDAFSFWPKAGTIGYSIRDERFRLTEWIEHESGDRKQLELYDHEKDPNETRNVAESNADIVNRLLQRLKSRRIP